MQRTAINSSFRTNVNCNRFDEPTQRMLITKHGQQTETRMTRGFIIQD